MALTRLHVAADAGFWSRAARAVLRVAADHGLPELELQQLTWVVPGGTQAQCARMALFDALGRRAFIPPRIVPLLTWAGAPSTHGIEARIEIYHALKGNAWIRSQFGGQPGTLWPLASEIAQRCDELTLAAVDNAEALDRRLQESLARHYGRRAGRALQAPAQLVLGLWRARRTASDGAARMLRGLAERVQQLEGPLVYLGEALATAQSPIAEAWETAVLERAAARTAVLHLVPDVTTALETAPLLAAAWPELVSGDAAQPIRTRADALQGSVLTRPLALAAGASLEDTAHTIAQKVVCWVREGRPTIGLVVLDRLIARRVRALLERAEIVVRDETGWKLSTTSAAAAVMRWFDLVLDDLYWRDLLDWLKSSFTLAQRTTKPNEVALIEHAIRARGAVQGLRAVKEALREVQLSAGTDTNERAGALDLLERIEEQVRATQRARPSLPAQLQALRQAMNTLGMDAALAADPVGRAVMTELDRIEHQLNDQRGHATLADLRALLTQRFEETAYVDLTVESPVVMVTLAAAALRRFDAVALIGADAAHLPVPLAERLFLSNAVRGDLGLATAETTAAQATAQLAAILTSSGETLAAWRARIGEESNPLSPLLERLQLICTRVIGDDLTLPQTPVEHDVPPEPENIPHPVAPQLLPRRVSASSAQSLVDCPYQFYARCMLGLDEPDDVIELPDKRDFGIALHEVLKRFHRAWAGADFSMLAAEGLEASLRDHARQVFEPQLARTPGLLAYQRRFAGLVPGYIEWLQRHASAGWRWSDGEQSHARELVLAGGRRVQLVGRIDRIDRHAATGRTLLIDYKARDPAGLRRGLSVRGEDVQLPFYGALLAERPDAGAYLSFERARDGESGVTDVAPDETFNDLVDAVLARLEADLQRIADGAALPAIGSDVACRRCEMHGLCRRHHWEVGEESADGAP